MGNNTSSGLPVAGIIAIAVCSWTLLILIFLGVRQLLFYKGVCEPGSDCAPCGKEDSGGCCDCCIALNESDSCCKGPSVGGCLDKVCPNRKSVSCVDILLCQCCGGAGGNCFTNCQRLDMDYPPPPVSCIELPTCIMPMQPCYCCGLKVQRASPIEERYNRTDLIDFNRYPTSTATLPYIRGEGISRAELFAARSQPVFYKTSISDL